MAVHVQRMCLRADCACASVRGREGRGQVPAIGSGDTHQRWLNATGSTVSAGVKANSHHNEATPFRPPCSACMHHTFLKTEHFPPSSPMIKAYKRS